jgi:antitoxin ParD1/3/4
MAKNTSILLGDYFDNFINHQIKSGRYASASEVVRAALRLFEQEESKKKELISELKKGEKSGFVQNFDRNIFLNNLHDKYITGEL